MTSSDPRITVFVDPACPFAWATSRWLTGIAERRGVAVTWRQMSLATLNEGQEMSGAHAERMHTSRRAGRLLAAAGDAVFADLYRALGRRLHTDNQPLTDDLAVEALAECGLDAGLHAAMDDDSHDDAVAEAHALSQETLGGPGGSPITVIGDRAFFGPVLTGIPDAEEGDRLFDGLSALATTRAFAQVERPRTGPPDLAETDLAGVA